MSRARFALVYLSSKAEALRPFVEDDAEALLATLTFGTTSPPPGTPEQVSARLTANRRSLSALVRSFCEVERIPFLDATPALEELARNGENGYLVADTHWNPAGQEALLGVLVPFLREKGLLGD